MTIPTEFKCGHCLGLSNCNCKNCAHESKFCFEELSPSFEKWGKGRDLKGGKFYYPCKRCGGTGIIPPQTIVGNAAEMPSEDIVSLQIRRLDLEIQLQKMMLDTSRSTTASIAERQNLSDQEIEIANIRLEDTVKEAENL